MTERTTSASEPRFFGVLVTYKRPRSLEQSLCAIASQERSLEELVIVDNAPTAPSREVVRGFEKQIPMTYMPSSTNLGPAGGRSLGAETIFRRAGDGDWVVFLDDDDPLPTTEVLSRLTRTISRMADASTTAAVGLRGAQLNRRTGRVSPVEPTTGIVSVDHLHGGFFPCYRVGALRQVGTFDSRLVFGFEELDLGLRLRRSGFALYADADLFRDVRPLMGHADPLKRPQLGLEPPSLRRYYALRNHLFLLRREGLYLQMASWALVAGILKPATWLLLQPERASQTLRTNVAAIRDASAGRLGPRKWDSGLVVAH